MLKFIRRYKQILLVISGVLLMIVFLVPSAISQFGRTPQKVTVMKIGQKSVSAQQRHELAMEYEVLNRLAGGTLPLLGISEGPEQWILLVELAQRGGYVGAPVPGDDTIEVLGRTRGLMRLRSQYGDQLFNSLINNPQFSGILENEMQNDIEQTTLAYPRIAGEAGLSDEKMQMAFARFQGVQRLIRAATGAARVSTPRAILRAERELEGAQIEYIFVSADRRVGDVPEPDDATLEAFLTKYKDVRPGEGELGVGYLLPPRVKLEYLILDSEKIAARIVPDLKELRRRYNALADKQQTFDEARPALEAEVRKEMVQRVMSIASEAVRAQTSLATRKLEDSGQFKILPDDWAQKRPTLAGMVDHVVSHVEEKTRPEPGRPGVRIDPPEVVVKDESFLTAPDLAALDRIGASYLERGQRRFPFSDYALAVREIEPTTPLSLQVGIPADEPSQSADGSRFFFTILDTRPESSPRSIDEIREQLVADWKKVEAYKLLVEQDAEALRQKAIAEGIGSLDESRSTPVEPGKPAPPPQIKAARVTQTVLSSNDPSVNTDTFRLAVIDAAEKLDPLTSADDYPADQRTLVVPLPQKLGLAVARIRSIVPLTVEDFRGRQNGLVNQVQADEFRNLKSNPFSLDRLRQRLNVRYMNAEGEEEQGNAANTAG